MFLNVFEVFLVFLTCTCATIFTSVWRMQRAAEVEASMREMLRNYVMQSDVMELQVPDSIRSFLDELDSLVDLTSRENYLENPIDAFDFIRRRSTTWKEVETIMNCDECELNPPRKKYIEDMEMLMSRTQELNVTQDDAEHAAIALVRLWRTYHLNLTELFRGRVSNTTTQPLAAEDIFFITNTLSERGDLYAEITWLQQLMASLKEDEDLWSDTVLRRRAVNMLTSAYSRYGMPWKSVDLLANELQKEYSKSVERDLKYYSMKVQEAEKSSENITLQDSITPRESHRMKLCRGEGLRDVSVTSRLYCLYRQVTTPYHRVKEEILNLKPRISLLYNLISDEEIEQFKELAVIRMKESRVSSSMSTVRDVRVSETAWMADTVDPLIKRLGMRIQMITGLNVMQHLLPCADSESFQVLNYGIGGMYTDHHDYLETPLLSFGPLPEEQSKGYPLYDLLCGERTATWIYYLSNVQAGGNTVFTLLNITVPVVKGGAAFWYNIDRAGVHDHWTEHAGCPVLIGSKWISNKWIRETGQVLKRTCGKNMNALDGPL
ncbi:prolyl 4-hydroxylase subunit alpha-1-like [Mya arenaria]|uniref:prolyl 4-hydroxylase subunit alpha-1-like n=1 Tax=Mya arenaria TaxID=6604 RepID=UPI0022E67447|nr:prolyl 4-hydroxylase subunit alpha-1-like [Mya arenaria]